MEFFRGPRSSDFAGSFQKGQVPSSTTRLGNKAGEIQFSAWYKLLAQGAHERLEVVEEVGEAESHDGGEAVLGEGKVEQIGVDEANVRRILVLAVGACGCDAAGGHVRASGGTDRPTSWGAGL